MDKIKAYAKLLRIPGIGGLAIPPVIGAMTVGEFGIINLSLLFVIGALAALYGFILNDYADIEVDKLSKELRGKPLVSGDISSNTALLICVIFILLTLLFIFILYYGNTIDDIKFGAVLCIFLAGILGSIYDFYGKKFAGSDFLVAISMGFVFLFGAFSFGKPNIITWVIFLLTFNNILHMNAIEGGIKDADHDYKIGVKNIALTSGVIVKGTTIEIPVGFKIFGMGIRIFSAFLLFIPFIIFNYKFYVWQLAILTLAIIGVLVFSVKLLSIKIYNRNRIRRYIAIQSFLRYSLVPIMLASIMPVQYSLLLIIFPIAWYILLTPLLGEQLFRPRM
jgi:4-hydroxybenzoate polyprenyltransferase